MIQIVDDVGGSSEMKVRRNEKLAKLLSKLRKVDELFEYNVPAEIRADLSDAELIAHLQDTYHQKEFEIKGENQIDKYVEMGDIIEKDGDYSQTWYGVRKGAEGEVRSVDRSLVTVLFYGRGIDYVDDSNLVVYGRKKGFFTPAKEYPETPAEDFKLKKNDLVRYAGEDKIVNSIYYPDGARGVVVERKVILREKYLLVLWLRGQEVKGQAEVKYDGVKVIRPNEIDFDELYKECYDGNLGERTKE